tara:strand:- start:2959 stop:4602 length:1644 start_codon:yes stop_codon:yes gene_type:complete
MKIKFPLFFIFILAMSPQKGIVVADNQIAVDIGSEILQKGNAFDAAVTTALILGITHPHSSGIGGGGFAVFKKGNTVGSLDFREMAPSSFYPEVFTDGRNSRSGPWAVGVPGELAGLFELHKGRGALSWNEVVGPATRLAQEGFVVGPVLANAIKSNADSILADPGLSSIFAPNGKMLQEGELCQRPNLAKTLKKLESGLADFYSWGTAESSVAFLNSKGGDFNLHDFESYETKYRKPVFGSFRGFDVYSMPPPSSGGIAIIQMLGIFESSGLFFDGGSSSARSFIHAMTHAFADRAAYGGDPDFSEIPIDRLLDSSLHATLSTWSPQVGPQPTAEAGLASIKGDLPIVNQSDDEGTTHFSILDQFGNAVSLTSTINLAFGSKIMDPQTGVIFNNEMDDFAAKPGVPNAFGLIQGVANAPGAQKRPLSSMSPTIVMKNGDVYLALGASGGPRIITGTIQTLLMILDGGLSPQDALALPRLHHQWLPETVWYEEDFDPMVLNILESEGFLFKVGSSGVVQVAMLQDGKFEGAADFRKGAAVKVQPVGD